MARLFDPLDRLTPRQLKIVQLAYAGESRTRIARTLAISRATLRWHTHYIRQVLPGFHFVTLDESAIRFLTGREREITRLVASGMSNEDIADHLGIVVGTVRTHLNHLYHKTGTKNRVQLIVALCTPKRIPVGATEAA
jgi:DNA-binding CsgD family transcriptional regulator